MLMAKQPVTFTAVVEDKNNNILPNAKIIWSTNRDQNIVSINEFSTTDKSRYCSNDSD